MAGAAFFVAFLAAFFTAFPAVLLAGGLCSAAAAFGSVGAAARWLGVAGFGGAVAGPGGTGGTNVAGGILRGLGVLPAPVVACSAAVGGFDVSFGFALAARLRGVAAVLSSSMVRD
jgi:hypothetical protein